LKKSHKEEHFNSTATVRDIVIGMSDGLTVPFALAAGLSGAVVSSKIVVTAGLAEVAAGAIAMGLGGYLAARTDLEHFSVERLREERETVEIPQEETDEVAAVFRSYGVSEFDLKPVVAAICSDKNRWVDFMMKFELGLETPDPSRAFQSAATIALSYIAGGMLPLSPYFFINPPREALLVSSAVTLVALFIFGFIKGKFTLASPLKSAIQTLLVGSLAATAAFMIARFVAK
jgi:VIT1/CCC1 family predicted Fe2+/Mn2+ transporter